MDRAHSTHEINAEVYSIWSENFKERDRFSVVDVVGKVILYYSNKLRRCEMDSSIFGQKTMTGAEPLNTMKEGHVLIRWIHLRRTYKHFGIKTKFTFWYYLKGPASPKCRDTQKAGTFVAACTMGREYFEEAQLHSGFKSFPTDFC
jgi:hypothetical protein